MVENDDERIIHAFRLYEPSKDFESFKARVIHIASQQN